MTAAMETIFSKIDDRNFDSDARREGVAVDSTVILPSNKVAEQNSITRTGDATLADFGVAFAQDTMYSFAHASRNQTQGRSLQLVNI